MTNRERMLNILNYEKVDRMPAVHFGYWRELLMEWAEQGHVSEELARNVKDGNEADKELDQIMGWDFNWRTIKGGNVGLFPKFEEKILEELPDGSLRVQNPDGIIERMKKGITSIGAEDDYQLKDRDAYEVLYKEKMKFSADRVDVSYFKNEYVKLDRSEPIGLNLGSVMGDVRNMLSVIGMSYMICDDYDLLKEIVADYADMQYQCTKAVLETGAKFDFAHYWEDVCFKNGPLLSPIMFDDLCAIHYKKRNDLVRSYGIDIISLDCDGVTDALYDTWFHNGVNTMFPIEIGTWGDQFVATREKYGKELKGVGGFNKVVFREDKAAVDKEIERISVIIKLGGFIPCPDHRIMPGSKFELVQYYIDKIKRM